MQIGADLAARQNLFDAAGTTTTRRMDKLNPLIVHMCLANAQSDLAQSVLAEFTLGAPVLAEAMTMPKRGFGPRPFSVLSPSSLTLYTALVENLRGDLPEPSRGDAKWDDFQNIGVDDDSSGYLVEFDITACYEYIDHRRLREELVLQSADADGTRAVVEFLGEISDAGRGLPQMLSESDTLSDAYLHAIERRLIRHGFDVTRFADDFKCIVPSWGHANDLIERAADSAREYGLVLANAKTNVKRVETVVDERRERISFFNRYFNTAMDDLRVVNIVPAGYEDFDVEVIEPEEIEARSEALDRILSDWRSSGSEASGLHWEHLPAALRYLQGGDRRISDDILVQMTFNAPIRLQNVLSYMLARSAEPDLNWVTMSKLVSMERQSAWAKLRLLGAAAELPWPPGSTEGLAVATWARAQLIDRHEVVRAQAAWFLAQAGELKEPELRDVSLRASELTAPALAASAGVMQLTGGFSQSLAAQSRLCRRANAWGADQA